MDKITVIRFWKEQQKFFILQVTRKERMLQQYSNIRKGHD
jgi:hypothetical protein